MKKFFLGVLATLATLGIYKLHAENAITDMKTQGNVVFVDHNQNMFKIAVDGNDGFFMIFYVTDMTTYTFIANSQGGSNVASFLDVKANTPVSIIYTNNNDMTKTIAEHVMINEIK